MKINPINYKIFNPYSCYQCKAANLQPIPYDSFSKVAFKGNSDEFIPAKTLNEAIEYGKSTFKIKEYKGFQEDDLDTLNWFNEGLLNLKRKMKNVPFVPPDKLICFAYLDDDTAIEINENKLHFSKKSFDDDIKFIKKYILALNLPEDEEKKKLSSNLTYLCQQCDMRLDGEFVLKSPYSLVYHEMGHIQHRNNLGKEIFNQISRSPRSKLPEKAKELVDLFIKNKKTVASRVSDYATESVLEFVAETFAGLCEGVKYDSKVMDLYQKLGGVII